MKASWVMTALSAVVCVVVSMVLFGQYALLTKLTADELDQMTKYHDLDTKLNDDRLMGTMLQGQANLMRNTVQGLEGEQNTATGDERQRATELDGCKADKKTKDDELAVAQKERADAEVKLSGESGGWKTEITSLKQEKEQHSKICAYIKKNSDGVKLCGTADAMTLADAKPADAKPANATTADKIPVAAS